MSIFENIWRFVSDDFDSNLDKSSSLNVWLSREEIHRNCYETLLHKLLPSIPLQGDKDEDFPIITPRTDNRSAMKFNTAYGVQSKAILDCVLDCVLTVKLVLPSFQGYGYL